MNQTLITFLGRTSSGGAAYRKTCYDFGDGKASDPVAFLGWPLAERLKPRRMVILGTSGSMWDHLFEGDLNLGSAAENERLKLLHKMDQDQEVEPDDLQPLEPLLEERLGCDVRLRMIPYCRNQAEQAELLQILAANVETGDRVH
ncbi:MAG: TIGR02221 family CRISPR-associated protein, partial [Deltaproteobacteria bacterium]